MPNPNSATLLLIEGLWSIVLTNSHLLMRSIEPQLYNVLHIPPLCVIIAVKVTLRTTVGQNMAVLANAPTILMEDIAVPLDPLNLTVLLDITIPRTMKDNVLLEVEEVLMGVNLSKVKHVLMK